MGKLINRERRLAAKKKRDENRKMILEVGRSAFMRFPFAEVTLESVDKATGLKQGKCGMLFGSKEELFLEILALELSSWRAALLAALPPRSAPSGEVAATLASSLIDRLELVRWMAQLHVALAGNVDGGSVHVFMHGLNIALTDCGVRLEACCELIEEGQGADRLLCFLLSAAAVSSFTRPIGALAIAMMQSDASWSNMDFEPEIRRLADHCIA